VLAYVAARWLATWLAGGFGRHLVTRIQPHPAYFAMYARSPAFTTPTATHLLRFLFYRGTSGWRDERGALRAAHVSLPLLPRILITRMPAELGEHAFPPFLVPAGAFLQQTHCRISCVSSTTLARAYAFQLFDTFLTGGRTLRRGPLRPQTVCPYFVWRALVGMRAWTDEMNAAAQCGRRRAFSAAPPSPAHGGVFAPARTRCAIPC